MHANNSLIWSTRNATPHANPRFNPGNMSNYTSALTGAANPKITQETMDQIAMVTDPYHDKNLRLSGYPDGRSVTSTLRRQAAQMTVSCPFPLTAGETWDFTIFTTPLHYRTKMYVRGPGGYANGLQGTTSNSVIIGPVNIRYRLYDNNGWLQQEQIVALGEDLYDDDNSPTRTVALAYELHNTTAEIYKSGSLTSYRNNVECDRVDLITSVNIPTSPAYEILQSTSLTKLLTLSPHLGHVQMLPNCRTWEASEGVYSVSLPVPDNQYCASSFQNICIYNGNMEADKSIWCYSPFLVNTTPCWSKLSTTGTMSSRLSTTDHTYTLDYRQVLEIAPIIGSPLLAYSTTAPARNPVFLELYERMFNSVECAVPVHYNSAGEWFRRITKLVKENLPAVINILPPQYRAPATALLPFVNKLADKIIAKYDGGLHQSQTANTQRMTHKKKK